MGRISESFAVGKYACRPNGAGSGENGGDHSGWKAVGGSDGWEPGQGVFHSLGGPARSPRPPRSHEASPAIGALLPEVTQVQALALQ